MADTPEDITLGAAIERLDLMAAELTIVRVQNAELLDGMAKLLAFIDDELRPLAASVSTFSESMAKGGLVGMLGAAFAKPKAN